MPDFRTKVARMDSVLFARLSDAASVNDVPVRGMFSAPWADPRLGSMRTGMVEPTLVLRDVDMMQAGGVAPGSTVKVAGKAFDVIALEPGGTGFTTLVLREVLKGQQP